jgi:integrase
MFNWAVGRDMLVANPCIGIKPPAKTTQRDRVLTDAEIAAVWNACNEVPQPFGAMVRMLMLTGARRNEIGQMQRSELVGDIWTLPAARSKSGRANALPLPPAVMNILAKLPQHEADGFVFSTTNGEKPASNFAKNKRALDQASGTTGWTLHDLRRTARTKLSELGIDRETARRIVGHAGDTLDETYDRATHEPAKRAALAKLSEHIISITS